MLLRFHLLALTLNITSIAMTWAKSLPLELVDIILGWARLEPEKVSNRTLVACSYVCKAWKARTQVLLFRDVPISLNGHQLSLLGGALSQCPELGRHIRSFGMEVKKNPPSPWDRDGNHNLHKGPFRRFRRVFGHFIVILTHSPNLVRLTINVDCEFDSVDVSKLTSINLRHIHTLNWEGRPTSSVLYSLLALWPSIRYLRINKLQPDPLPEHQRPASLRSLCVGRELPESFMTWLVPTGDDEQLRELHFEDALTPQVLKGILLHAPTLHVLTVDDFPPQSLLDALTALNELAFRELPSVPVRLPLSVQRVRYHFWDPPPRPCITLRGWDDEVDAETVEYTNHLITALMDLPKLTLVSATRQSRTTPKEVLAILEKFCREKKVEFDVYDINALYSVSTCLSFDETALINSDICFRNSVGTI